MIAMDPFRPERSDALWDWGWLFYQLLVWEREQRYQRALRYVELAKFFADDEDSSDNSGDEVISYDIGDDFEVVD